MRLGSLKILTCVFLALTSITGFGMPDETNSFSFSSYTTPTITGPDTTCAGVGGYIYYTEPGEQNYFWTIIGGDIIYGQYTDSITVTWNTPGSGTLTVIYNPEVTPTVMNVTVLAPVVVGITISASENPVCSGTLVTFTASVTNGGSNPSYQWKVNDVNVGTNQVFSYAPSDNDIIICQLTSDLECTTGNPVTSNPIIMTVMENLPVSISITSSSNPSCQGTMVTFTATGVNGGNSPTYQWKVNGIDVGTNDTIYSYAPTDGDVINCVLTSDEPCSSGNPSTSNFLTMTVSQSLPVGVTITASPNPSCQGSAVTLTAILVNGGTPPFYQWYRNSQPVGSNQGTYSYTPVNGDTIYVVLTSNVGCATGNPATSNELIMTVLDFSPVSVTITASENPVCAGFPVTYTATPVNGGSSPIYQ